MLTSSPSFPSSARTRSGRRAASTARSTPRARATAPGSLSTTRSMAASSWRNHRPRKPRARRSPAFSTLFNTKGEGDSPWKHFDDTVYGGDFLANQPPVKAMCEMAPAIIYLFDRMGVPFSRTTEGLLDFRRFGGTLHHRTAFAGASTGQQLLYALDEQVRRHESSGKVKKYEHWEMLSLIQDGHGVCRGLVAMERSTLELKAFPADAVIMATGGPGLIFGKSTNSMVCTGSAVSACYQQGARYANGEFIQVHPTSIPGEIGRAHV